MSPQVVRRVTKEVMELAESPPEGIKVFINDEDITDIQATITGPGKKKKQQTLVCFNICGIIYRIFRAISIYIGSNHIHIIILIVLVADSGKCLSTLPERLYYRALQDNYLSEALVHHFSGYITMAVSPK